MSGRYSIGQRVALAGGGIAYITDLLDDNLIAWVRLEVDLSHNPGPERMVLVGSLSPGGPDLPA